MASTMPGDKDAESKADVFAKEIVRSATGAEVSGTPEPLAGKPAPAASQELFSTKGGGKAVLRPDGKYEEVKPPLPRMKGMPGPGTY